MSTSKAVAKPTPAGGAVAKPVDYGADAGAGFENQTRADISMPFLTVLQGLSPQVADREDAKAGMLFNSITEEVFPGQKGRVFVPATTKHCFVEWVPRDKGGGFVGIHEIDSPVVAKARAESREFGKYKTPAGNDLQETFYIYGMMLDDADQPTEMVVIGFASTKIAVYKRWNTKVNMFTVPTPGGGKARPPLFAHKTRITTVKDNNPKGDFFNFDLQPANNSLAESLLPPGHAAMEAAKGLRTMVEGGLAKPAYDTARPAEDAAGGSSGAPPADDWQKA